MPAPYRYASKLNRVKYHLYCQVVCEPTDEGCHKGYEQVCQWPRFELVDGDLDASRTPKERFALGCPLEIQVETLELQTVDENVRPFEPAFAMAWLGTSVISFSMPQRTLDSSSPVRVVVNLVDLPSPG